MIPDFDNLCRLFSEMSKNGFDSTQALKWGFYFFDTDVKKLQAVYEELKEHHYVLEDIEERADNEYALIVSKIEILTPELLHKRNIAFNELAAHCSVAEYDGWDVEKI